LTHELLVIEGVDNDASRSIAWVMFHEVNAEQWAVGGRFDDHYVPEGGRFLVLVSVPLGGLFARGKKDDVAGSLSKCHGVPGVRIGWAITRNARPFLE
jgi:hypothetical protein